MAAYVIGTSRMRSVVGVIAYFRAISSPKITR